jgi:hypothetical protein
MGIDGIGKKGPTAQPPADEIRGGRVVEAGRPFEVTAPRTAGPTPLAAPTEPHRTALERLRAGEVDVRGYLDLKVSEATAHLAAMPTPELEALRNALRERLASDPTLVELARTVTGRIPDQVGGDE